MSIQSFTDYLDGQALTSQGVFAKNYTAWLDNVVLKDSGVQTWLHGQLTPDQSAEFLTGQWHIDLQQNSHDAAPIIAFADGTQFGLDKLFAADLHDANGKESFTLAHGQERFYVDQAVVPPALLAVAFTDVNGNHTYEEGTDKLIAALLDANHDGIPDAGDKIEWGTYPTSIGDGSGPRGTFTSLDTDVTAAVPPNPGNPAQLFVDTASGSVLFASASGGDGFKTGIGGGGQESILADSFNPNQNIDGILVTPSFHGPGLPNDSVSVTGDAAASAGNQAFLDVLFFF
jgi:hypothetical protein